MEVHAFLYFFRFDMLIAFSHSFFRFEVLFVFGDVFDANFSVDRFIRPARCAKLKARG